MSTSHERQSTRKVATSEEFLPGEEIVGTVIDAPLFVQDPDTKVSLLSLDMDGLLTLRDPQGRTVLEAGPCPAISDEEKPELCDPARRTLFRLTNPENWKPILEVCLRGDTAMLYVREPVEGNLGALLDAAAWKSSCALFVPTPDDGRVQVELQAHDEDNGSLTLVLDPSLAGLTLGRNT